MKHFQYDGPFYEDISMRHRNFEENIIFQGKYRFPLRPTLEQLLYDQSLISNYFNLMLYIIRLCGKRVTSRRMHNVYIWGRLYKTLNYSLSTFWVVKS